MTPLTRPVPYHERLRLLRDAFLAVARETDHEAHWDVVFNKVVLFGESVGPIRFGPHGPNDRMFLRYGEGVWSGQRHSEENGQFSAAAFREAVADLARDARSRADFAANRERVKKERDRSEYFLGDELGLVLDCRGAGSIPLADGRTAIVRLAADGATRFEVAFPASDAGREQLAEIVATLVAYQNPAPEKFVNSGDGGANTTPVGGVSG